MPPAKSEKPSGKKSNKKKKKGPDEDAAFQSFLDDMFFISQPERQKMRMNLKRKIREVFTLFQERGSRDVVYVRELGIIVRELGLNPTQKELAIIQTLVEDPEAHNLVPYSRLEKVLLDLLETKELRCDELTCEGMPIQKTVLVYKESDRQIQMSFDTIWEALGSKEDNDQNRYIDSDDLKDYLVNPETSEGF
eukprot:Tbor_TRINITY_DN5894_c0_g1::TRINITY_DN5894_c0_g1_i1::g.6957::m.6957